MICEKCKTEKPISEFRKFKTSIGKKCRDCIVLEKREWDKNNKQHVSHYNEKYRKENIETCTKARKRFYELNKEYWSKYNTSNYQNNVQYRKAHIARVRIGEVITKLNGVVSNRRKIKLIGCFRYEFIEHLEKKFRDGMTWENYGELWEVDHVIPLSFFDLKIETELLKACFYKNLQPLLKIENKIKSNKILINA